MGRWTKKMLNSKNAVKYSSVYRNISNLFFLLGKMPTKAIGVYVEIICRLYMDNSVSFFRYQEIETYLLKRLNREYGYRGV